MGRGRNVLAKDPHAVVLCPHCGKRNLEVVDQGLESRRLERHMRCPACGAYNSMLIRSPI